MNLAVKPLHPLFAAELRGVDLAGDIDGATERAIEQAMDQYVVCVLPAQKFASSEHKRELHRTTIIDTRGDLAVGLH